MQEVLLRKLIEKDYFKRGTEIDATYRGVDLSGAPIHTFAQTFTITGIFETRKTKRLLMDAHSVVDGRTIRIAVDNIVNIDGMTPERFAENYMIDPLGEEIKPSGRRRGRRPKGWVDPDLAIEADDSDDDAE
jgi:hypothetical protein